MSHGKGSKGRKNNTTQYPVPGLEPGLLDPGSSALTVSHEL